MTKEKMNLLGDILQARGIKNQFIAVKLGVSKATVSGWVTNKHQPTLEALYCLSALLDIEPAQLLNPNYKPNFQEAMNKKPTEKFTADEKRKRKTPDKKGTKDRRRT